MLQLDFVTELFRLAKGKGVNTAIDTAGEPFTHAQPFFGQFERLLPLTDLFLLDLKHIDPTRHKQLTGTDNLSALALALFLSERGKPMWIRHVLVPGYTTDEDDLRRLAAFIRSLATVERVEVLPYHAMAVHKYEELRIPYRLDGVESPDAATIARAEEILGVADYTGYMKQ